MSSSSQLSSKPILWSPQPKAWRLLLGLVDDVCRENSFCHNLRRQMADITGTRLVDWLDAVIVEEDRCSDDQLTAVGFHRIEDTASDRVGMVGWHHPGGLFPTFFRPSSDVSSPPLGLVIKVESVDRFLATHQLLGKTTIHGIAGGPLRWANATPETTPACAIVERHGYRGWLVPEPTDHQLRLVLEARQLFDSRPRPLANAAAAFREARERFQRFEPILGRDWTCDLFFASERAYWQRRNQAARVQRGRQDKLGLGWANHDHHTYRSSREYFADLVQTLELMGFECRERFYAGAEAGWGAQVLEQPTCGLVVFADVDMSAEEVAGDFAHQGLTPRQTLGTVGLWCKLHGEAFSHAGLHHLECQFDFDAARSQLDNEGIETMAPFTDFPHLRQAFTEGDTWRVSGEHLTALEAAGFITAKERDEFARQGARGSHLEILERNDGYKGFNQTGISDIIARTDPRHAS